MKKQLSWYPASLSVYADGAGPVTASLVGAPEFL